jgi:hypothetical protein
MTDSDTLWCRDLYDSLAFGGTWGIPRSGLIFTKRRGLGLQLTEVMPWMPEMEGIITKAELAEQQRNEFASVQAHFHDAGISVWKAEGLLDA